MIDGVGIAQCVVSLVHLSDLLLCVTDY